VLIRMYVDGELTYLRLTDFSDAIHPSWFINCGDGRQSPLPGDIVAIGSKSFVVTTVREATGESIDVDIEEAAAEEEEDMHLLPLRFS